MQYSKYVSHKPRLAVHGAIGCGQKSFKLVRRCYQLLIGFLAYRRLLRVQSRLLANDKDDEMIPRTVCLSDIYLMAEKNTGELQIGDCLKICATSHRLKWGRLLLNYVGKIARQGRKRKEIRKEKLEIVSVSHIVINSERIYIKIHIYL